MIQAYVEYWKRFCDFKGTTSRAGYWWAFLAEIIVGFVIGLIAIVPALAFIPNIFSVVTIIPGLAIVIRRLRDAGYKWYNIFWAFLPIAGFIILIILLAKPTKY